MAITLETLTELIAGSRAAREEVEQEITAVEHQLAVLERKQNELQREEEGHRLALARLFPESSDAMPTPVEQENTLLFPAESDLAPLPRTVAVEAAVRDLSAGSALASPSAIEQWLHERGRSDERDAIGAALSYLNKRGSIRRESRGAWRFVGSV